MLQRDVHIPADLRVSSHLVQYVFRKIRRIRIMYPYPPYTLNIREFLEKSRESTFVVEVKSVISSVLSNEDQFLHAGPGKFCRFCNEIFNRNRTVRAADERNRAIRAAPVTAFRNLQESIRQSAV